MAGHAQLQFVMTECSKTQIRLTGPIFRSLKSCHNWLLVVTLYKEDITSEHFMGTHKKKMTARIPKRDRTRRNR